MAVNSYREDEFMENTDKKKIMRRLFSYLLAYKGTIIAVLVCMGITVAISLVNPLLIEEAIDHYIAQSDLHGLIGLGIFALVLNLIFIVMVKLRMYAMAVISNKILLQIRQDLYEHIQTLSFSFFDSRPTGKILARIIGDVNSLKDVLVNVVTTLVPEFVTVVGVVVIMLVKDWRLALASLSTINMFWNPIMNVSNFYNNLVTNLTAAERIFDILDTDDDIVDAKDVTELPDIEGSVEFSHVSFTYDKGTPAETKVLSDVSFSVKPGETIALVGPTGAGKTTIVNLISRFYDIEDGKILVDGYDLTKVSIESLRRQMGVMTQDNFIFHGTVRDNILYGKLDATDEEMIAAAKAVNAHDFIMKMEKGYDTELKEHGAGLSIGQRQLIAFARTMISMPKILILDEATSSIDTHTELLVQQGIEALLSGRTSFVIAHRLSTIQNADRIFVIDKGGILEQGSPAELMEKKGAYYKLYMAQFAGLQE